MGRGAFPFGGTAGGDFFAGCGATGAGDGFGLSPANAPVAVTVPITAAATTATPMVTTRTGFMRAPAGFVRARPIRTSAWTDAQLRRRLTIRM
jgi:hypothetical protein